MESFRKLGLSEPMIKIIEESKFKEPSEIQEKTIPLVMQGRDVIGGSATGSGKTLAFGAGIIEKAEKGKGIQSLILVPTRELAEQVASVLLKFSTFKNLNISVVYGGVGINPQIESLESADIVVGTPGRILDHMERRTINLNNLQILVLDEADRMLDMGFIIDVEKIISSCPKKRQTLLFSATISEEIERIASKYMIKPEYVSVESYVDASLLQQIYYDVPKEMKFSLLVYLLQKEKSGLVMVFCNTRTNTDFVANNLINSGIDAIGIHGGLSQDKRNRIMEKFHSGRVYVLVCTDVAARGLDIKNVSHVYNYDSPKSSKEYIHRIGRTARAGNEGIAVNIISERDYESFRNVLMDDSIKVNQVPLPTDVPKVFVKIFDRPRGHSGGSRFGQRSSGGYGRGRDSHRSGSRDSGHSRGRSFGGRSSGGRGRSSGRRY